MPDTAAKKSAAKPPAADRPSTNHDRVHQAQMTASRAPEWLSLTARFQPDEIEKLPKPLQRDGVKARCQQGTDASADGHHCGGWHSRAVHLDYVGHAGITTRLNEALGQEGWTFEPYAHDEFGLPLIRGGQFWGRLTLHRMGMRPADGSPRLDVSKVDVAESFNSTQEAWGDCLRRCAMRFGIGTYLWSKSERAQAAEAPDLGPAAAKAWADANAELTDANVRKVWAKASAAGLLDQQIEHGNGEWDTLRDALSRLGHSLAGDGA
jgi:hypothetical protein